MLKFKIILGITLAVLAILLICEPFFYVSFWWYILLFLLLFWLVLIGSFSMSWSLFLKAYTHNTTITEKKIAITFDDGPNHTYTPRVLQLLKTYNAKATFFCIGKQVEKHPEILKIINAAGHAIGNHSFSHSTTIGFKSTEEWLDEIKKTDQAIFKVLNHKTDLFRPPFGVTTPHLAKAIKVTGHHVIGWNIRPFDMAIKNPKIILNRIIKNIKPGSIILLHDKHGRIEIVLEQLLQFLKKKEYKMVTINELLDEK